MRDYMSNNIYYFAYGSNMNLGRMQERCEGAETVGKATLADYTLVEREYADIDYSQGDRVEGVLYLISEKNLEKLDLCEGVRIGCYYKEQVEVECGGNTYQALVYIQTVETKAKREGKPYPPKYREICSSGADSHGVINKFRG